MGRGRVTDDATIERIRVTYAMTGNGRETARLLGIPLTTIQKYINPETKDDFVQLRSEKLAESIPAIIDEIEKAQRAMLAAMMDQTKIREAELKDIVVSFGILTDKHQLLSGEATERHEHRDAGQARDTLARRIDELAERRRARGTVGQSVGTGSG